jgi:hypothetical protein
MKYKFIPLLCLIVLLLISGCHGNDGVKTESKGKGEWECYYISGSGDDHNPGSFTKPWKTLEKINHTDLKPGDNILLELSSRELLDLIHVILERKGKK